ncbi:MAG: HAD family phosphatase [Dermatophilus congolensis]|nr:HAD family phosphatase [Dermatophilus congolensis]
MSTEQRDALDSSSVRPAAVLWDMDGTLIDSEPYWIAEEFALVESFGGTWSLEHSEHLIGANLWYSAEYIREHTPVTLEPVDLINRLQSGVIKRLRHELPWRPGARELLGALGAAGVPCGLVTMSWRAMVDAVLETLPGAFAIAISGDEVSKGKPDPEPYLVGAEAIGVPIEKCIALEDSPTGVASAYASGARTIAIPHVVSVEPRPGLAFAKSLTGLSPSDLVRLTDAAR